MYVSVIGVAKISIRTYVGDFGREIIDNICIDYVNCREMYLGIQNRMWKWWTAVLLNTYVTFIRC
jgi:hypothetical protein